ncbi:MAG: hypothetical protein ACYTG4_12225, partial [Planctomycetota bacterium]
MGRAKGKGIKGVEKVHDRPRHAPRRHAARRAAAMAFLALGVFLAPAGALGSVQDEGQPATVARLRFEYRCYFGTPEWRGKAETMFLERLASQHEAYKNAADTEAFKVADLEELYTETLWERIDSLWTTGDEGKIEAISWSKIMGQKWESASDSIKKRQQDTEDLTVEYSLDQADAALGKDNDKAFQFYQGGLSSRQERHVTRAIEGIIKVWKM